MGPGSSHTVFFARSCSCHNRTDLDAQSLRCGAERIYSDAPSQHSAEPVCLGREMTLFILPFGRSLHCEAHLQSGGTVKDVKEETSEGAEAVWQKRSARRGNRLRRVVNMFACVIRVLRDGRWKERTRVVIGSSVHPLAASQDVYLPGITEHRFIDPGSNRSALRSC